MVAEGSQVPPLGVVVPLLKRFQGLVQQHDLFTGSLEFFLGIHEIHVSFVLETVRTSDPDHAGE